MASEVKPMSSRWQRYLRDWRTFPADAALGFRHDGFRGVWNAFAERSVYRVARMGRLYVFAHPLDGVHETSPPPGVSICPIGEGDWQALSTLIGQRELERFRLLLANGRQCLVAWRGPRPVGYAWVADTVAPDVTVWPLPLRFPKHAAYLYNLYVVPGERSHGIGSALASARLQAARRLGYLEGWRMVSPSNVPSLRTIKSGSKTRLVGEIWYLKLMGRTFGRFKPRAVGSPEAI